jgi:hypothetical protein
MAAWEWNQWGYDSSQRLWQSEQCPCVCLGKQLEHAGLESNTQLGRAESGLFLVEYATCKHVVGGVF